MISSSAPPASAICRLAEGEAELEAHFAVRRQVFVETQRLFVDDRDARDGDPATLHAVALVGSVVVGAVRLYPLDEPGLWKGDRLAVLPEARVRRLGAQLVGLAVQEAGARGGRRMIAQVQTRNVRFFELLGWAADGEPALYRGVMHQPMATPLRAPGP